MICLGKTKGGLQCSMLFKAQSPETKTGTTFLPDRPWHCSPSKSQGINSVINAVVPKCCSFPERGRLQPFLQAMTHPPTQWLCALSGAWKLLVGNNHTLGCYSVSNGANKIWFHMDLSSLKCSKSVNPKLLPPDKTLFRADPRNTGRPCSSWYPSGHLHSLVTACIFIDESAPGSKCAHSGLLTQKIHQVQADRE